MLAELEAELYDDDGYSPNQNAEDLYFEMSPQNWNRGQSHIVPGEKKARHSERKVPRNESYWRDFSPMAKKKK